jgi:hypothetical protein
VVGVLFVRSDDTLATATLKRQRELRARDRGGPNLHHAYEINPVHWDSEKKRRFNKEKQKYKTGRVEP